MLSGLLVSVTLLSTSPLILCLIAVALALKELSKESTDVKLSNTLPVVSVLLYCIAIAFTTSWGTDCKIFWIAFISWYWLSTTP